MRHFFLSVRPFFLSLPRFWDSLRHENIFSSRWEKIIIAVRKFSLREEKISFGRNRIIAARPDKGDWRSFQEAKIYGKGSRRILLTIRLKAKRMRVFFPHPLCFVMILPAKEKWFRLNSVFLRLKQKVLRCYSVFYRITFLPSTM